MPEKPAVVDESDPTVAVFVCTGPTCGLRRGSQRLLDQARARAAIDGRLAVVRETCLGHCVHGPNVLVCPSELAHHGPPLAGEGGAAVYHGVDEGGLDHILDRHLEGAMAMAVRAAGRRG